MLSRIDAHELCEWQAFYCIEPFGEERMDLRIADAMCLYANANRSKGRPPFKPADFMRFIEKPEQSPKQQERFLIDAGKAASGRKKAKVL